MIILVHVCVLIAIQQGKVRRKILKSLTRRELLNVFSKDTLKNIYSLYHEYKKAEEEGEMLSCEEAGLRLGRKTKKNLEILGIKI